MTQKNQKLLLNKKIVHPTDLSVYVAKPMFKDNTIPYITTDRLRAWRFSSKKEAKNGQDSMEAVKLIVIG